MGKAKPKHRPEPKPGWYLKEWLLYLNMNQRDIIEATGRSKGRISELVNGIQRFNEDDLTEIAGILEIPRGWLLDVNPATEDGQRIIKIYDLANLPRKVA